MIINLNQPKRPHYKQLFGMCDGTDGLVDVGNEGQGGLKRCSRSYNDENLLKTQLLQCNFSLYYVCLFVCWTSKD